MQKIISAFCLVLVLANVKANNDYRTDDYINMSLARYKQDIEDLDAKLKQFSEQYAGRIDSIDDHYDLIRETLVQSSENLNPLTVLSEVSKECVKHYSADIPTILDVKKAIEKCIVTARSQQTVMLSGAVDVRNALESYLQINFVEDVKNCRNATTVSKHVACVSELIPKTNKYVRESRKNFFVQLEAALCVAKASVKRALECNFGAQEDAIAAVAKANLLIDQCISEKENCNKTCQYQCKNVVNLPVTNLSHRVMHNPLSGLEDNTNCLILCAY